MSLSKDKIKEYVKIIEEQTAEQAKLDEAEKAIRSQNCKNCNKQLEQSAYIFYCPQCVAFVCSDLSCLSEHAGHGAKRLAIKTIKGESLWRHGRIGISVETDTKSFLKIR